ncbi:MAG: DUF3883 domain-containing protein [Caulobacter sp.]|nr:DUF3883 domain-containing protein [Caulobacter sp.]
MSDLAINGKTWTDADHDLVVGDYFVMLDKTMRGLAVDPATHQRALRFVTGRSGGAITFLQGELSAALSLIGLPTLKDHPPRWDIGEGLVEAIDRYLTARPSVLKDLTQPPLLLGRVAAPVLAEGAPVAPPPVAIQGRLAELVARFDPALRDQDARILARIGVAAALAYEQERLVKRGRSDLADLVRLALPPVEGCDLLSFSRTGEPRHVAVKATTGGPSTPFALTPEETALSQAQPDAFQVYRLYDLAREARVFRVRAARQVLPA